MRWQLHLGCLLLPRLLLRQAGPDLAKARAGATRAGYKCHPQPRNSLVIMVKPPRGLQYLGLTGGVQMWDSKEGTRFVVYLADSLNFERRAPHRLSSAPRSRGGRAP
jgi:hypothetical protein